MGQHIRGSWEMSRETSWWEADATQHPTLRSQDCAVLQNSSVLWNSKTFADVAPEIIKKTHWDCHLN